MKTAVKCCAAVLVATIIAAVLRLPDLTQRPMHTDEAVHAIKFAELLQEGRYNYDPEEFHGPTLNFFTLIPARLAPVDTLAETNEFTLRIVPVFFGILMIVLLLLLLDAIGPPAVVFAAFLAALSPAFVYYSRYYIQETLLACFCVGIIAAAYRYSKSGKIIWALITGLFLGLAHATKETFLIAVGSMAIALVLAALLPSRPPKTQNSRIKIKWPHIAAALAVAIFVSALFYSSFFTNPSGVADSVRTYLTYFERAGTNSPHIHPWYYYLHILLFWQLDDGPLWSEAFIIALAIVGLVAAIFKKPKLDCDWNFVKFIAFYAIVSTIIYSAIPYKTPWCLLSFLHGLIILAGIGAAALIKASNKIVVKVIVTAILILGLGHLGLQAYSASYKYPADQRNPYVYAHTSNDIYRIVERINHAAAAHPDGRDMYIQIICPDDDYWPLPWYLRDFTDVRYWNEVNHKIPTAPLIIASADIRDELIQKLYISLFSNELAELRPGVYLIGLVELDLWDKMQSQFVPPLEQDTSD